MIRIRKAADRGATRTSWLDSRHTFSFADYRDPAHMGFRSLRVVNDDRVEPGAGFGTHGHRDMEILTYVVEGALVHEDSTGTRGTLPAGHLQRMSAGTGIRHSELNASATDPLRLVQIWILPGETGLEPGYEELAMGPGKRRASLRLVAAPDGGDGVLTVHRDARVYVTALGAGDEVAHEIAPGRGLWVQVVSGEIEVDGERLAEGDGAAVEDAARVALRGVSTADVLVFDLA